MLTNCHPPFALRVIPFPRTGMYTRSNEYWWTPPYSGEPLCYRIQRWCHLSFTSGTSFSPFTWLTSWPTRTYGKKLRVLVYWVPFICSCRPALCVWHSLVASHFITRILTTRILFITQEVTFAVASDEFKRERVKEYVPKKSSTCIWGLSVYRVCSASIASCFSRLRARERPLSCSLAGGKCFFQSIYVTIVTWHNVFFSAQQDVSYRQLKAKSQTQFR